MKHPCISFCITCMNRLEHLQATLEQNILDNCLEGQVEFVLLDYHSSDGLPEWTRTHWGQYLESGVLKYYLTEEPQHYLRSHSRNMAFRLAEGDILCNLDADNFLGEGFAKEMLDVFTREKNIFCISSLYRRDVFGRVSVAKNDFLSVRGYNEALVGYGMEDAEFFYRLLKSGLQQRRFTNPEFYKAVKHSDEKRIDEEPLGKDLQAIYLHYIDPYTTEFLMLKQGGSYERGTLCNNRRRYHNLQEMPYGIAYSMDRRFREVVQGDWECGSWKEENARLVLDLNGQECHFDRCKEGLKQNARLFYKVSDKALIPKIVMIVAEALNFMRVERALNAGEGINPQGFGRGTVCKNFDTTQIISLQ